MAEIELTQTEADRLMAMEKYCSEDRARIFPQPGERLTIPLISKDRREAFFLDITRVRIKLTKATYQNRARSVIILLRLDLDGAPHRNPDGEDIPCPHLHIYREGYGDKWAIPAPADKFPNAGDLSKSLEDFVQHCNIMNLPRLQNGLF